MSEEPGPVETWAEPDVIRSLLVGTTVWAVVGLRDNPARPAWGVARWLQGRGKQVVPVHPLAEVVHGAQGYPSLTDVPIPVDVVDLFVRSERVGQLVDEAVAVGARAVWMQLGVVDEAAAERARSAGLDVVMDRCPAIEGPRYLGA
jgi:predicted CoA-binding protein